MPSVSTGSTAIQYGASLRIGYRPFGSVSPYTYLAHVPTYNELPYTFTIPSSGAWDIQYSQICPSCQMPQFSDVETVVINVL